MPKRKRATQGDPKRAVAYLRVSTDADRQELGAEAQRQAIEQWATREGVSVVAWVVEEVSGSASLDRRPLLLEAVAACGVHGAGVLAVQRLDRFSRDPLTAALAQQELARQGASLGVVEGGGGGDDPTSELVRGILLSVAKFERAMIRARIKAALSVKKRRGERTGSAPFGCRVSADGKTLEPCEAEAPIVARIVRLRFEGCSERDIVEALRTEGVVSPRSKRALGQVQVHRLLARHTPASASTVAA